MIISGTVIVMALGGVMLIWIVAGFAMAVLERQNDAKRRHWLPAESAMQDQS